MDGHANAHAAERAAVIVFGLDEKGRHHASRFEASEATAARQAAALMGMHALGAETPQQQALMARVPVGRIFGSGKAFVPFVKPALYESLATAAGIQVGQVPKSPLPRSVASAGPANSGSPEGEGGGHAGEGGDANESGDNQGSITVGSVVLATTGPAEGYYEAKVVEVKGDTLKLEWRDFPDEPGVTRRAREVTSLPLEHWTPK